MKNKKGSKKPYEEILERNRKEKERVLRLLESEGIPKKSVGKVLEEFTQDGFPLTLEGIIRMIAPLIQKHGLPKMGVKMYPEPPSPVPIDWQKLGMRYFFEFNSGQTISVVIANDGKTIIRRCYEDNGNIHIGPVIKTLQAWQKI